MHICFLTDEYPTSGYSAGGVGTFVQALSRALVSRGIRVSVVGWTHEKEYELYDDEGVTIYKYPKSQGKVATFIKNSMTRNKLLHEINQKNPIDILEGAELSLAFVGNKLNAKKIIRMHGGHHFFAYTTGKKTHWWRSWQEKKSFSKADGFIAVSEYVGKTTLSLLKRKERFEVIYNLVNTDKFYKADRSKIIKNKILFVGTIVEKKGVMELVNAMRILVEKYKNVELELIGRDQIDKKTHESFTQKVKNTMDSKMHQYIHFLGPKPHADLPKYIEEAAVCVYPSHMEAQGIVVVEAMSMGKAVVFSKTGPGKEMIQHGYNGLLCDPYDPKDIAKQVAILLDDVIKVDEYGTKARESVLKQFNMESIIDKNISYYKRQL